jgi:hypothetical protein
VVTPKETHPGRVVDGDQPVRACVVQPRQHRSGRVRQLRPPARKVQHRSKGGARRQGSSTWSHTKLSMSSAARRPQRKPRQSRPGVSCCQRSSAARPARLVMCPRHQQATPDPLLKSALRIEAAPELPAARHAHQRLLRHPRAATAWNTAHTVTTRWYEHDHHLADGWRARLNHLTTTNPHLATSASASPTLLARDSGMPSAAALLKLPDENTSTDRCGRDVVISTLLAVRS